ncbi:hypothetical protein KQY27_06125 [Methanobrevibacter sp. TMH8]|uniref:hypothetical protein n=1 Tax=Methanobrevibacter sp. TMH8 TaxID=2848611 RepID=UPI001CCE38C7|nr:hypothetical protein [Methanobrevibacter sp. TMH8]MBZ9571114.1 hypothetical protein [Methanobrevibacter sp. TMH8]
MNKKILIIAVVLVLISVLTIFSQVNNDIMEIDVWHGHSQYINLGNDVMVDIGGNFDVVDYNIDNKSNGISLKNNYSTVYIQYFSINDFKLKKNNLTTNNNLNVENNKNLVFKNESKDNIANITVYSKTFENEDKIIQLWSFKKDNFSYLITANMSSENYNNEKYGLILDDTIKKIVSSLTQIENS